MMYHCFSRPRLVKLEDGRLARIEIDYERDFSSMTVLESILSNGLACTSERLQIAVDPLRLQNDQDYPPRLTIAQQSRACFTLTDLETALSQRVPAQFLSIEGQAYQRSVNHFELFGPIAIAIDPIVARRMGALPTLYYYKASGGLEGGPEDILRRLAEIRDLLAVLNHAEEQSGMVRIPYTQSEIAEERTTAEALDLIAKAPNADADFREIGVALARKIFKVFDTDRRSAWQLVDKLDSILGLFQNTDSSIEDSPLAFYEQREWRIPFLSQSNLEWYSLGGNPKIRDPHYAKHCDNAGEILANMQKLRGRPLSSEEIRSTWILTQVDNRPFADFIAHLVCPNTLESRVEDLLWRMNREGQIESIPPIHTY